MVKIADYLKRMERRVLQEDIEKVKDMKELTGKKKARRKLYVRVLGCFCVSYGCYLLDPGFWWMSIGGAILFLSRK